MSIRFQLIGLLVVLCGMSINADAQTGRRRLTDSTDTRRGPYAVVLTAGTGLSYYATHLRVPATLEQTQVNRFGVPVSFRAMWYPDHRLRVGLESGWITMYNYRGQVAGEPAHENVSVVPILVVFSMPLAWLSGTERSLARRLAIKCWIGLLLKPVKAKVCGYGSRK